jgi:hypothetical protein
MQAAYCVGGHWFTAALIECSLLKGKAMAHRPQFVSLGQHLFCSWRNCFSFYLHITNVCSIFVEGGSFDASDESMEEWHWDVRG